MKNKLLTPSEQKTLIQNSMRSDKYHLIVLLMIDQGLRITEVCKLRIKDFDFTEMKVSVLSLKKRSSNPIYRDIPLSRRTQNALSNYFITLKNREPDSYMFPTNSKTGYIGRWRVLRMIKKMLHPDATAHSLRHTFATRVVNEGNDIRTAQKLLGHKSARTTEIYLHVDEEQKKRAIESIEKKTIFTRLRQQLIKPKPLYIADFKLDNSFVARRSELITLHENYQKKINTIFLGAHGIGKSAILKQLSYDNILRLDDFKNIKQTLVNLLMAVSEKGKEQLILLISEQASIEKVVTTHTATRLIELIKKVCNPSEFTLIIDDLTDVTKAQLRVLEKLKNIFHIICAARHVKVDHATFISNFDRVVVEPLKRKDAYMLIDSLSRKLLKKIENYDIFRDHIFNTSAGNPLYIRETISRFAKESFISVESVREFRHASGLKEIDMSLVVIISLSSLMVLRYIGGEFDDNSGAYRLFGGVFLVFALFARTIFQSTKRKFI